MLYLGNVAQAKCRKDRGYMPTFVRYGLARYRKCETNICHTLGMRPKTGYKDENPKTRLKEEAKRERKR